MNIEQNDGNMIGRLAALARRTPGATALVAVDASGERRLDYAELERRVRALAALLQSRYAPGERALLLLENDEHYVVSFFACLYTGLIAVPVFPPESIREQHLQRLTAIAGDAAPCCLLASAALKELLAEGGHTLAAGADVIAADIAHAEAPSTWQAHCAAGGDIAFLQYTSGSTSTPKGVMVSHANLMANELAIQRSMAVVPGDVMVSWLPLYHDMGLIGGLLQPIYSGVPVILMSPRYFLERPIRWLEAISRHRGTLSGGPDFAYRLCLERIRDSVIGELDLSSWRLAFSGAEPVRAATLNGFTERFAAARFAPRAVYPCYGLAEATLLVSGGAPGAGMTATGFSAQGMTQGEARPDAQGPTLVSCGVVADEHQVLIVEPAQGVVMAEGQVGEIWVGGASVAQGYWRRARESAETFVERAGRRWLRTGDLGFFHQRQLYISGRIKDLIIVRGQNLYPQDLEQAVENEVDAVRKGRVAAFAVDGQEGEGIGLAVEVSRSMQKLVSPHALVQALNEAVAQACREPLAVAVLLQPGALPKTSSGKLQRGACRQGWRDDTLDAYAVWQDGGFVRGGDDGGSSGASAEQAFADELETTLAGLWQQALKRPVTGRQADFFTNGGNSLTAMRLAAHVGDQWSINFAPRVLFETPRLHQCADEIRRLLGAGQHSVGSEVIVRAEQRPQALPLSFAQHGLWLTWQLNPDSPAYNLPGVLRLKGALDPALLQASLRALVARHAALRTIFVAGHDGVPHQLVREGAELALELPLRDVCDSHDQRDLTPEQVRQLTDDEVQHFARRPFRLDAEIPLRAALWRLAADEHILALSLHHIAADGWSIGLLLDELGALYAARGSVVAAALAPLPIDFSDYALWQRERMREDGHEHTRQLDYWRAQLGNEHPVLALPLDYARAAHGCAPERRHGLNLPPALSARLRALAQARGVSLYMLVLSLFKLTLQRFTGATEIRVGSPMADRGRHETEGMVGYLINVLVLATRIDSGASFTRLLEQVRATVLAAQAHRDLPFDLLVGALQPERVAGVHPLFQVKCTQQNELSGQRRFGDLQAEFEELTGGEAHFDLSLDFTDRADGLYLMFSYSSALFKESTIVRFGAAFEALALQVEAAPELPLGQLSLPAPLSVLDGGEQAFAAADVLALWRAAVERDSDAAAVRDETRELSYAALDAHVQRLAGRLRALGIGAESRVGIYAERSCEFVLGVLAVLKAGGAYVPLDPQLPAERLLYQLRDSASEALLSAPGLPELRWSAELALTFDDGNGDSAAAAHAAALTDVSCVAPDPQQAAYIIYTSGSTGKPKGVVVTHGNLANYVQGLLLRLDLPESVTSMAMVSTVAADLGHTSFFGALCSGRLLHLIPHQCAFDPDRFAAYMARHHVDVLKIVPSHLQALLQAENAAAVLPRHTLVVGGEATAWSLLERIATLRPGCRVVNHYGPTETTVGILTCEAAGAARDAGVLPVGRPLPNAFAHVLDGGMNQVPQGVAGELYLGGAGVARGYLAQPAMTAERFVPDPFRPHARLYRSGDLVRQLDDGSLEFLGRIDDQVKIRGYRVELREIHAVLLGLAGVGEAAVIAAPGPDGRQQLQAYLVPAGGVTLDTVLLRRQMALSLPDYMLPATLTALTALPLTVNGKLDRRALPAPQLQLQAEADGYAAPQGEAENILAEVWAEVLGVARVGRHDNFFELGGDSILTLKIVARARKRGLTLSPKQVMEKQSVAAIVDGALQPQAAAGVGPAQAAAAPAADSRKFALTPVQRWFTEQRFPNPNHWNQSVLLTAAEPVDSDSLRQALVLLAAHHETLRLRFGQQDGGWQQWYADERQAIVVETIDVADEADPSAALARAADQVQRGLDLAAGPLMRAAWLTAGEAPARLLLTAHHLIIDGVSWRILLEDLETLYRQVSQGQTPELPSKTSSFATWSQALAGYAQGVSLLEELPYWENLVARPEPALPAMAASVDQAKNLVADARVLAASLDAAASTQLLGAAAQSYRIRVDELLLSALSLTLCEWTGRDSVLLELEAHGREDLFDGVDVSRTLGWFTALYPARLTPGGGDLGASIRAVTEQLRAVPNKGIGYGVLRYLNPAGRALAQGAVPQLTFNYLGRFEQETGAQSPWRMEQEGVGTMRAPDSTRRSLFDVVALMRDGRLHIEWTYNRHWHNAGEVQALLNRYLERLRQVIVHCAGVGPAPVDASEFPLARLSQDQLQALGLPADQLEDLYPLSPMQSGMLFHSLLHPQDGAYVNQLSIDIEQLDAARFRAAWQAAFERHPVLRTAFVSERDVPLQWVATQLALPFEQLDYRAHANLEPALAELAAARLAQGFDLSQPGLMRLTLVQTGAVTHRFIWTRHHLLLDGWSSAQLLAEVMRHYGGQKLAPVTGRYRDYIGWLQQRDLSAAQAFWRDRLRPLEQPTHLAACLPPPGTRLPEALPSGPAHAELALDIDADTTRALLAFVRRERVTFNTLLQAAWALLLQRYSGQATVAFGATTAGRPAELAGVEHLLGLFINTLPVIVAAAPELAGGDWLRQLQAYNLAMREHEHTPLYEIQRWAGKGGQNLFDSILVVENYPVETGLLSANAGGLAFTGLRIHERTSYAMSVVVTQSETVGLRFGYDCNRFDAAAVAALSAHFVHLLKALAAEGQQALGRIGLLDLAGEAALAPWRRNERTYAYDERSMPVHRQFERQARERPHAPALVCGDQTLSYAELNARANRLAHHLIAAGAGPDKLVAIVAERSVAMVVGLLAILKAGAAYLPLDPDYPADRLAYMLADSRPAMLLTQGQQRANDASDADARWPAALPVFALERLEPSLATQPSHNPELALHGDNLAYVIYTSGSTGKPKGAANRHRSLHNRLAWMQEAYAIDGGDTVLQKTPFSFDVSVWEFFWPLISGARLVMAAPGDHRDPARLCALIDLHAVTTIHFVPSMLQAFMADLGGAELARASGLKRIICSGEALPAELRDKVLAAFPGAGLYNLYGPTEAAIDITHWTCVADGRNNVPIGQPIAHSEAHILDSELHPVAPGVAGELYLGGIGLARGYLHRPGLTSERFVADPFSTHGARLYRTGDLARWRADGQIEYLGRLDHQVKIRGLRIELGEIEAQLLASEAVREAVVVAQEGTAGTRLVAYVVPAAGSVLERDALVTSLGAALAAALPDYMVPGLIVVFDAMPLNANGKIDRKALPAPQMAADMARAYAAPEGNTELALAAIWSDLLGVERIGRSDNFFELGGHSLLASGLVARLRYRWADGRGVRLPLASVFSHPTLAQLAACIGEAQRQTAPSDDADTVATLMPVARDGRLPLSPMQQRLWLIDRMAGPADTGAYNMSAAFSLTGQLSLPQLHASLQHIVERHEILRTAYLEDDEGEPFSSILSEVALELDLIDLSGHAAAAHEAMVAREMAAHAGRRFDLRRPPLLRASVLRLDAQSHVLLFAIHHMVADGWSVGVLIEELVAGYGVGAGGPATALPALPLQYADYAAWQRRQWQPAAVRQEQAFWRAYLDQAPVAPFLPADLPRPALADHAGQRLTLTLPAPLRQGLQALAAAQEVTPFMLLLASFQLLMHRHSGVDDLVIGTDVAGRGHPELEGLIGFFVNLLPVRSHAVAGMRFPELLAQTRRNTLQVLEHQDLPFERIVEAIGLPRERRWNPLVQVLFVLQNTPQASFDLPGLTITRLPEQVTRSKFDMALFVSDSGTQWSADWVYASSLFKPATVAALAAAWLQLLEQLVAAPAQPLECFLIPHINGGNMIDTAPSTASGNAEVVARPKATSKLDKLKGMKAKPFTPAAATPKVTVRPSFLAAGQSFPLVLEPALGDLDPVAWARDNRAYVAAMLERHAGILFRGFGLRTPQEFEAFAEAIEPELYGSYGDLPKKEGGNKTYRSTPYPEQEMILYHNESAHMERWPRKQWFYCELPSPVGGATPIVDCREMYRRLPPALAAKFEAKGLLYVRTFTERLDVSWREFFKTDQRSEVEARLRAAGIDFRWLGSDELQTRTLCPAVILHPVTGERVFFNQVQLHHISCLDADVRRDLLAMVGEERMPRQVLYGDGTPIEDEVMAMIGQLYEQCAVRFDWRQGDIVMLDNMLAAHARDPFQGPRKIVVAMGAMFERADLTPLPPLAQQVGTTSQQALSQTGNA